MLRDKAVAAISPARQNPQQPGLLLIGFKAWAGPQAGTSDAIRERLGASGTRAVWNVGEGRLAFAATEHDSTAQALEALAGVLEANQLAEVPRGPATLGEISFVHPSGVPPAAFFVRANLVLSVVSFSRAPVDVLRFAHQVDTDLVTRPEQAREDGLEVAREGDMLQARLRWGGPDAYLKFFASGATLRKSGDAVIVAGHPGEIEVFAIERGRETYVRRLPG